MSDIVPRTQTDGVLSLLKARKEAGVTSLDALQEVGTMRLAHHIFELRQQGYVITTYYERKGKKQWGRYVLREEMTLW